METKIKVQRFEDLEVWKTAHELALNVYKLTRNYPSEEKFGLVSQMRKAAVSVPANIAEGFKKRGLRDKINFYNIAQASLEELRYYFILSCDLGYCQSNDKYNRVIDLIGKMLHGLIRKVSDKL